MSRFGCMSEERPSVFKTPSKLGTHLSTQCSGDTDHQIGTSVHAPQRPMVTCIMMGTVVPGSHGLLCLWIVEVVIIYRFWNSGAGGAGGAACKQKVGGSPPRSEPGRWFVIDKGFGDLY
ncbi:hypothetical protein TNCV_2482041 [Trichonephila clavipes]|nr:hypothetical protein TNCV_2482041 [Trichonephila clavipes]